MKFGIRHIIPILLAVSSLGSAMDFGMVGAFKSEGRRHNQKVLDKTNGTVSATGPVMSTIAGDGIAEYSGDSGQSPSARLNCPAALAIDSAGNIYIADKGNNCVRKIIRETGTIYTIAGSGVEGFSGDGGPAPSAKLWYPAGVAISSSGDIYIADSGNNRIRKVDGVTGIISSVAGTGLAGLDIKQPEDPDLQAATSKLNKPVGVAVDGAGNVYIADSGNHQVRRITVATGLISKVAGNVASGYSGDGGLAVNYSLNVPTGVAVDKDGNIYIADSGNNRIRKVAAATGIITTVAGSGVQDFSGDGGLAVSAGLNTPYSLFIDPAGNIYFSDYQNQRIRKVSATTGGISTIAGSGSRGYSGDGGLAVSAWLNYPAGVVVDSPGNIYIADYGNHRVRKVVINP